LQARNYAKQVAYSKYENDKMFSYEPMQQKMSIVRKRLDRPFTLAEKILYSHLDDPQNQDIVRGKTFLRLRPDRVAMQVRILNIFNFIFDYPSCQTNFVISFEQPFYSCKFYY